MRVFDYLMLVGGVVMLFGAARGARRQKDIVEVTALASVGLAITVLGIEEVSPESVPVWVRVLATVLLLFGGLLFLGLRHTQTKV